MVGRSHQVALAAAVEVDTGNSPRVVLVVAVAVGMAEGSSPRVELAAVVVAVMKVNTR